MPFIGANEQLTVERKDEAMEKRYRGEKLPTPKNGSAKLKKIVLKACEYNPEDRYASAQEMYDDLDRLRSGKTTGGTSSTGKKKETSGIKKETKSRNSVTVDTDYGNGGTVKPEEVLVDDGKTGGNSWRDGTVTVGKKPEKKPKTGKSNFQDEPEKKTEGVKDAYQRQKEKEKKKERTTVVADVPVQAKKKSGGLKNILVILIVIGIAVIGYNQISSTGKEKGTEKNLTNSTSEKGSEAYTNTKYYDNGNIEYIVEHDENGTEKWTNYRKDGTLERTSEGNKNGETKTVSYDEKGELKSYGLFEYDENGNWIKSTYYDKNDKITQTNKMEYDGNGNRIKITIYDGTGKVESYRISEYDLNNNWTKETSYDGEGKIISYFTKEYDSDNNLVKETNYDGVGNIQDYSIYEESKLISSMRDYTKYDASGNIIEYGKYVEGDGYYYCKKYDANWNEIEE